LVKVEYGANVTLAGAVILGAGALLTTFSHLLPNRP
jgi:hypothetical protein